MFNYSNHGFDGCDDNRGVDFSCSNDSFYPPVYPQQQLPISSQPLFRSQYASKVRVDIWCQKSGCFSTMGPPRVPYTRPQFYLKKHSRLPPVFFDPNDLKATKLPKINEAKGRKPSRHPSLPPIVVPKTNRGCLFADPPKDLGLFRRNSDPTYEELYRTRPQVHRSNCDCGSGSNFITSEDMALQMQQSNEGVKIRDSKAPGYNGPVNVINRGRRDFLKENALKILRMPAKRPLRCYLNDKGQHRVDLDQAPFVLRPGFGQVPKYLEKRKQEIFEEEMELRRQMKERSDCRAISDAERCFIIQGLEDHWSDLNREYLRLPTHGSSYRINRLKAQLEEKFKELEDDIRLFKSTDQLRVGNVSQSQYC